MASAQHGGRGTWYQVGLYAQGLLPAAVGLVLGVAGLLALVELGAGGFAPLAGGDEGTCELRKMYFLPELRGAGMGARLLAHVLRSARAAGFTRCYLETLTGMDDAARLYRRFGFEPLQAPLGATGHHGCDRWMARGL